MSITGEIDVLEYCEDLHEWPRSWMIDKHDLKYGEELVEEFKPFIKYLISTGLTRKTISKHIDNLWLLGGELISSLYRDKSLRKLSALKLISRSIADDGGPYSRHLTTESEQKSFDATCRKLHKFMAADKEGKF
jgi:hypothetical protein